MQLPICGHPLPFHAPQGKRNINARLADMAQEQWKTCTMLIQLEAKRYIYLRISEIILEIVTLDTN